MIPSAGRRTQILLIVLGATAAAGILLYPRLRDMLAEARRIDAQTEAMTSTPVRRDSVSGSASATDAVQATRGPTAADIQSAEDGVRADPDDYAARLRLASLLGQSRRYPDAVAHLKNAAQLQPNRAEPYLAIAEIHEATGDFDLALDARRTAHRIESANSTAIAALANTYIALGWHRAARELLDRGLKLHPRDPALRSAMAHTLYQMMDYRGALSEILEAKRLDPENHALDGPLIDIHLRLNNPQAAANAAAAASIAAPDNMSYRVGHARSLRTLGQIGPAEQLIREVLTRRPDSVEARYELALILSHQRHDEGARKALEAVVGANPLYESATALLAQHYHRAGRQADARVLLRTFEEKHAAADPSVKWSLKVGSDPNNAAAHLELGRIHLKRGKTARAIVELKEAIRLKPQLRDAQAALQEALRRHGRL